MVERNKKKKKLKSIVLKSITLYRGMNDSRKAESCFCRADPKEDLRMETHYLGGTMVWMLSLLQITSCVSLSSWRGAVSLISLCLHGCFEAFSCLGQCFPSSVKPCASLDKASHNGGLFKFLNVWGSLERMKRNFDLSDCDALPNRCFQRYFSVRFLRGNLIHWKHSCNGGRTLPGSASIRGARLRNTGEG